MFRVTQNQSLEDLFRTLPAADAAAARSEPLTRGQLSVVGQERGGFLVVAVADAAATRLLLLEAKALQWTPLLSLAGRPDVAWASVNADRSLVAITLRGSVAAAADDVFYESFIVAASAAAGEEQQRRLPLHERTRAPQRAQFLFDAPAKQSVASTLLLTVVCEGLLLYTATCQRSAAATSPPVQLRSVKREQQLVGPHLWAGLSQRVGELHYVVPKPAKDRSPPQQLLRTVFLGSRKALLKRAVLEQPFSACIATPQQGSFPLPYTLGAGTRQIAPLPYVRYVALEGGARCLCVQHEFPLKDGFPEPAVPVTIIAFHLRLRIDFSIPLATSSVTYDVLRTMRVIFDSIADFLVVYIPGHHLHLLDLGELHNPIPGVVVAEMDATPLPPLRSQGFSPMAVAATSSFSSSSSSRLLAMTETPPQEVAVAAIDLVSTSEQRAGPDVAGHTFLDLSSGVIFEYSFDRKRLLQLFETPNAEMHIQLLHTACIHMEDMELVHQIVMHVLNKNPENAKVSLLKEFIVGAAFQTLRGRVPYPVLLGVPATTSDQQELLQQALRRKTSLDNVFVSAINQLPSQTKTPGLKDQQYSLRHLWAVLGRTVVSGASSGSGAIGGSGRTSIPTIPGGGGSGSGGTNGGGKDARPDDRDVIEYFKSLFGGGSSGPAHPFLRLDGDAPVSHERRPSLSPDARAARADAASDQVVAALASELLELFPRENRATAFNYAQAYVRCLNEQAEVLFTYIVQSFSNYEDPKKRLLFFQALENMYCAVTELGGIPLPRGFQLKFAMLSFECLSETLFLQYVDRGVIKVSTEVLCELQEQRLHERRPELFYHLLCKLGEGAAAAVLLSQPVPPMYLVEHLFSKNPQLLVSSKGLDLDVGCEDSPFIPLSLLLKQLQVQAQAHSQPGGVLEPGSANALTLPHALDFAFYQDSICFQQQQG